MSAIDVLVQWAAGARPIGVDARWLRISGPTTLTDYWTIDLNERDGNTILTASASGIDADTAATNAMREWNRSPYQRRP